MKTISLIIILLLIFAGNLSANRYYVDADYGNDSNSGESESSAWKTLDKVNYPLNPFNANDIISFKCGSIFYDQTLIPPGSNLVFNSYGSGPRPVIDAEGDSVNLRMCVAVSDPRTNLRFEGIKFIHGWLSCLSFWNSSNVTINNCDVESALQTSYTQAAPGMLYVGGSISAQVNHWTVTNSTFNYSLYGHAMYWDGVKDILLDHDTIMYNGANGVQICSSLDTVNNGSNMDIIKNIADSVIVRYCVIRQNATYGYGETGLFINSATNSKFYYNVIENHSISTYSGCIQLENNYGTPPSNSGFYNNTIICHGGGHIAIYLGGDGAWTGMDSLYFKNNLIYSDDPNCYALYMSVLIGTNSQFTNNLYYYPAGGTRLFHMGPDDPIYDYPDIFTWKTASYNFTTPAGGYEAGSVTDAVNATFDSIFSNLQLKNGSNAISKGVYLGLTQDITGKYVSDPPDIGAYQNSIYLSGTLSANTTLNGNVAVTGNVTTPTNVTLTISPGTNMKFASGCSLTINGPCKAVGSSSQPVTFTSLSGSTTPGSWGSVIFNARRNDLYYDSLDHALVTYGNGIQCRNGTQVTISNSQINNCTYGFNLYQADAQILNNTVENPAQEGIYMDCPYYQPIILGNIIRRTTDPVNYAGFYAYGSGPEVINNYISGFYTGALFSSCYIESGQYGPDGCNNEITGNVVGLRADHVSLILLGGDCGGGGTIVPNNSIFGNTSYDLSICDTSLAEGGPNYFGAAPYNFDIDASSSVDFDTYGEWTSNPCGGSSKITNDPHLAHSSLKKTVTDNLLSGQLLEKQGRIDDAIAFYLELINNNDHVRFALLKLAFIMKKYSKPEITTSLENLLTTSNNNYCKIKNTLGNIYLQSNRFDDAITAFNDAIDHSSTDYDGINARFGKLFGYLNIGYNIPMASQVLSNIKGLNLTDNETLIRIKMAENLIVEAEHGEYKNSLAAKIDQPQSYDLSQNYPNPFNPSTKINYQIPRAGNVSLKVYDILGRQIVTLVNEYKNEGRYSVNFNASRYASGVYIYQLRAGSFVSSKKMVLTK